MSKQDVKGTENLRSAFSTTSPGANPESTPPQHKITRSPPSSALTIMATVEQAQAYHREHPDGHGPAPGETAEQHAAHAYFQPIRHWGLGRKQEAVLFYCFTIPSWIFCIVSAALGSYDKTFSHSFIACATIWLVLWATAWLQTAVLMAQRASWVRDEANLKDRKQYLYLSVRLQRLMIVSQN